ncbi:hypothetical protein ENBRE01_2547 [Enteropsectra breve]|nr:hypothetical protein ENBRE01_2547 [Enteropsectra breve]
MLTCTSSVNCMEIIKALENTLNLKNFHGLTVDMCLTVGFGVNRVCNGNAALFKRLQTTPNHEIFFSSDFRIANVHFRHVTRGTKRLVFEEEKNYTKLNCYLDVEDILFNFRKHKYPASGTAAMIKSGFYGHKLSKLNSTRKIKEDLDRLVHACSLRETKAFSYRIELRFNLLQLPLMLQTLISAAESENFLTYEFNDFSNVFSTSIASFRALILSGADASNIYKSRYTTEDWAKSLLHEYCRKQRYLYCHDLF